MGAKVSEIKKEVGDILKKIFSKLTPNQGKIGSLVLAAIIAVLFLCTATGRAVIVFIGYLIFALAILTFAYKLYKFASQYSIAEPKPKAMPKVTETAETTVTDENDDVQEEELAEGHQITMDELESNP